MSGAVKNMFGAMLGAQKLRIHNLFPDPPEAGAPAEEARRPGRESCR